ncbi:non-canonical purine NTP diphosphatase [Urechidicola croceus]|uniref:dITP/XTP pyrophosphatase n=1 Tax=Urechidicola croceus TaxID=1850246 RepID=A0A1D8P4B4_9FLAO|nr:non-canonical purine NTP diphosphatase [Urechidicola croceus]AOW19423.1 non-canonical purine NTP pyrophosphatase [Urechidicola croceus]
MKIVFATNNANKLEEVKAMLPSYEIVGLKDIGCFEDIPETADTLEGNAKIKADYITTHYGLDCFADDTGLEVEALNGAPGVYSARYAGEPSNAEKNIEKLLIELKNEYNRNAQFTTVIVLNLKGIQYIFKGMCEGEILTQKHGKKGFGYDPVFKPNGYITSFAQMTMDEKGAISHRGKAVKKLIAFLNSTSN